MTIWFDIGSTLMEGPSRAPAKYIAAELGLSKETAREINNYLLKQEINDLDELIYYLSRELQLHDKKVTTVAANVWKSQLVEPHRVDGGLELIGELRTAGIRYGFISNIWKPYADAFHRLYGELSLDVPCIFSYQKGKAKPSTALYEDALSTDYFRIKKDESSEKESSLEKLSSHNVQVMIGDSYENDMDPAMRVGMGTVWILARPNKEKKFVNSVAQGKLPRPSMIVDSIKQLTLERLMNLYTT